MYKPNITLLLAFCLLMFARSEAQIQIKLGDVSNATPGTLVNVPIYVSGFSPASGESMSAIDLRFYCDSTVATFHSVANGSSYTPTAQWIAGFIGESIRANWLEPNLNTVSFPDNTIIIEFVLNYKGGNSPLIFEPECEVLDGNFNIITEAQFLQGSITQSSGSGSTNWNGTGLWTEAVYWNNGLPGDSTDAQIQSGTISIRSAGLCRNLTITQGATLQILPGYSLTVNGNLINHGQIIVQADTTLHGSLIVRKTITQDGNTNIWKNTITGKSYLIGSPINNCPANIFSSYGNLSYLNEPNFSFLPFSGSNLTNGMGYLFKANGNHKVEIQGFPQASSLTVPLSFSGAGQGWNLLANPFPSAFSVDSGLVKTNTEGAVYAWHNGRYLSWNGTTGTLAGGIIPPVNGFLVRATANNAQVKLNKKGAVHSFSYFSGTTPASSNTLPLQLLDFDTPGLNDQVYIQIAGNATFGFDQALDAWKLPNADEIPEVYVIDNDNNAVSIAAIPYAPASIKLGVRIPQSGFFAFNASADLFNPGGIVLLYDKELNATKNLRTENHTFQAEPGTYNDRFELLLSGTGIHETPEKNLFRVFTSHNDIIVLPLFLESGNYSYQLYDVSGRLIETAQSLTGQARIRAIKGLNILIIRTSESVIPYKLMVF